MKRWICTSCRHIHPGVNPPMVCPECGAEQKKFEYQKLRKEDYAKVRQGKKKLPNHADVIVLGTGVSAFTAAVTAAYYGASVIMMETGAEIGGGNSIGFSDKEKAAAFKSIQAWEQNKNLNDSASEYKRTATSMIEFLAEEDLLPEFAKQKMDPLGAPHPWQEFVESTMLDYGVEAGPETQKTLLHQLAHWSTDNGVRMLMNHQVLSFTHGDEENLCQVNVEFNEKERSYGAEVGIISFLPETPQLIKVKDDKDLPPACLRHISIEAADLSADEISFWGEEAFIGPAMTKAYKTGMAIVVDSGLLDEFIELQAEAAKEAAEEVARLEQEERDKEQEERDKEEEKKEKEKDKKEKEINKKTK